MSNYSIAKRKSQNITQFTSTINQKRTKLLPTAVHTMSNTSSSINNKRPRDEEDDVSSTKTSCMLSTSFTLQNRNVRPRLTVRTTAPRRDQRSHDRDDAPDDDEAGRGSSKNATTTMSTASTASDANATVSRPLCGILRPSRYSSSSSQQQQQQPETSDINDATTDSLDDRRHDHHHHNNVSDDDGSFGEEEGESSCDCDDQSTTSTNSTMSCSNIDDHVHDVGTGYGTEVKGGGPMLRIILPTSDYHFAPEQQRPKGEDGDMHAHNNDVDDDSSSASTVLAIQPEQEQQRRVEFFPKVLVVAIPSRHLYPKSIHRACWTPMDELTRQAKRNTLEYQYDGWDWRTATEEHEMYIHKQTGEHIHPVHVVQWEEQQLRREKHLLQLQLQKQKEMAEKEDFEPTRGTTPSIDGVVLAVKA